MLKEQPQGWEGSLRYQVLQDGCWDNDLSLTDANRGTQQVSGIDDGNGAVFVLCLAVVYAFVRLVSNARFVDLLKIVERRQPFIAYASHEG